MFRMRNARLEVLLVHPGGPFWAKKDEGAWSIPKGEIDAAESALAAAQREFLEEIGIAPQPPFLSLGQVRQRSGKLIHAWACKGECDTMAIKPNVVMIEWPPRSGKKMEIPEVDRAEFFSIRDALRKVNPAQVALIQQLRLHYPSEYERSAVAPPRDLRL
jgi:predicted NUDIX family NTP pyrophosphohydrolase